MYELRVLSGLHRGTSSPLTDKPYRIGSDKNCDLVLDDPGIAANHATLWNTRFGWLLTATDGNIHYPDSDFAESSIELVPGICVCVGDIRLEIVAPGRVLENYWIGDTQTLQKQTHNQTQDQPYKHDQSYQLWKKKFLLFCIATVTLVSATVGAMVFNSPSKVDVQNVRYLADMTVQPEGKIDVHTSVADNKKNDAVIPAKPELTSEQLRKEFRERLSDAALAKRFHLSLKDQAWTMDAELDDEETKRFERILVEFLHENRITFPVNAKISRADESLPFKIQQVVSGANPSLVTQDGQRIYVGEEYRGVRVVAIKNNHLTLGGKRKIEMNW